MSGPRQVPTQYGYDLWAETYDDASGALRALEEVEVDRLLEEVAGLRVLDAGCGTGRHAVRLAGRGAAVTGVDFSEGMLARASAKPGAEGARWVRHDLEQPPLPFEAGAFERVVSGLVLDHIERLEPFLRELRRVCAVGGRVVLTVVHPAVLLKGLSSRLKDPATGELILPAYYPHQVSDYVMAAMRAGLRLEELCERAATEELVARVPGAAAYLGWPLLLAIQATP